MTPGRRFAEAFAAKDRDALRGLLAPDVDFKGMTPRRLWEADSVDEVLEVMLCNWVDDQDHIDGLVDIAEGPDVADTQHVSYRMAITNQAGPHVMEQQAYYRAGGGRITYLRIMCSGFRPTS